MRIAGLIFIIISTRVYFKLIRENDGMCSNSQPRLGTLRKINDRRRKFSELKVQKRELKCV